jgi:hypothetical protein
MEQFHLLLTDHAKQSFIKDLKMNGIKYQTKGWYIIVDNTPKTRMAIQLVKERFSFNSIIVKSK